jgi:hypothetical protein
MCKGVKLAILSNNHVDTKICIQNNVLYFQEPVHFKAICRYINYRKIYIFVVFQLFFDYVQRFVFFS